MHANTVSQRLARIGELLGPSWREPARSLEVQVALRLLKPPEPVNSPHIRVETMAGNHMVRR